MEKEKSQENVQQQVEQAVNNPKKKRWIKRLIIGLVILLVIVNGIRFAQPGEGVVSVNGGWIIPHTFIQGVAVKVPVVGKFVSYNIWEQEMTKEITVRTKDLQDVKFKYTVVFNPNWKNCHKLYSEVGLDYQSKRVTPVVTDILQTVIGTYNEWVFSVGREDMRKAVKTIISNEMDEQELIALKDIRFTDVTFSPEFEAALNRKSVAAQDTLIAIYKTISVREQANQEYLMKEAEARGLKLKVDAIGNNPFIANYEMARAYNNYRPENMTLFNGVSTSSVLPYFNAGAPASKK